MADSNEPTTPQNPVPLGSFQPMTDDEIDAYAGTVTPADIELLRSQWKKYVAPRFAGLVDAIPVETVRIGGNSNETS
jgi:hypothetical protein